MIQLNNIVSDIKEIDPIWTFSYYCNIPVEHFDGSTIKIKSIFKPDEKTPSLSFYSKNGQPYKFNCFSTSNKGDHINLVEAKFNMNYSQSCFKIINDYTKWVLSGASMNPIEIKHRNRYKVVGYNTRVWTVTDSSFWVPFDIGSSRLKWGNVKPLLNYKMSNGSEDIIIAGENIYGYFTATSELYKIYQPKHIDCKFITVNNKYIIGSEHKKVANKFYVILSSWKDAMSFEGMGLSIDLKVPASENTYFTNDYIKQLKREYKNGFSLLDIDDAGKKAMLHYKKKHNIDYVYLDLSKDFSDSIRDHGKSKVMSIVIPLIHKSLNN